MNTIAIQQFCLTATQYILIGLGVLTLIRVVLAIIWPSKPEQNRQYREFIRQQRQREVREKIGLKTPSLAERIAEIRKQCPVAEGYRD